MKPLSIPPIAKNALIIGLFVLALFGFGAFKNCGAQYIGGNGGGFFENYDHQAETWLKELGGEFTLRLPGGPIDKFADPHPERGGWGLTVEGVDSIQIKYGSPDEEEQAGALEKWRGKAASQPAGSYLDSLIKLQTTFPALRVIWSANMYTPPARTVEILQYLISGGVNIIAVEMGNETYSQLDYNFADYSARAGAMRAAIKAVYPAITISQIAAPIGKGRKEQDLWNSNLAAWIPAGDFITQHYYIGEREIFAMADLPDRKTTDFNNPDPETQTTFYNIAAQLLSYQTIVFSTADSLFAGHTRIITETNTQPAALIGDTYLNSAYQFRFLLENRNEFNSITWHNFVSPDIYGMICLRKKTEAGTTRLLKRTTYHSFNLVRQIPLTAAEIPAEINFDRAGEYLYYFENVRGAEYSPVIILNNGTNLDSTKIKYIYSDHLSSNILTEIAREINIIPVGYGYIQYYVSERKIIPTPCTKPAKCNRFFYSLFNSKKCRCI